MNKALELHKKLKGKLTINSKIKIETTKELSLAYTPGVAEPCKEIAKNKNKVYDYTIKGNTIAVITDGTAVLGLGDIGAEAALPVMEGKAILFKELAGINAFPIALNTKNVDEIVSTIKNIAPSFGGINLEDIASPRCFEIESRLQDIGIPVMHDDQHGTAIVVYAALKNALKVTNKKISEVKIVINGAGAAGMTIARLLTCIGYKSNACTPAKEIIMVDSQGIIHKERPELSYYKQEIAQRTNKENIKGTLKEAIKEADVFIGVSKPNALTKEMIKTMKEKPIILALANPIPEIMPEEAIEAGAYIIGTGRSDYPNQINNVLAFPGVFKGALEAKATKITPNMKMAAAEALANSINPTKDRILPSPLDKSVVKKIAEAVKKAAIEDKVIRE
ncbi:MAG: NADP-dependent malic enzyme [Candidatus Diapherotrites archaeon]